MKLHIDIDPHELCYLVQMLQHPKQPEIYNKMIANILRKRMPEPMIQIVNLVQEFCDQYLESLEKQYQDRYGPTPEEAKEWYTSVRTIKSFWRWFLRKHGINRADNQPFTSDDLIAYIQETYNVKAERNGRINGLILKGKVQ